MESRFGQVACPLIFNSDNALEGATWIRKSPDDWPLDASKRGLSQEALADRLGVSRQAVSKWERAESLPDTDNLIALAAIYGLTLDELLWREAGESDSQVSQPASDAAKTSGASAGEGFSQGKTSCRRGRPRRW